MKIGLFLALFSDRPLAEALDAAAAAGCETVEIMSGAWSPHCRPAELLESAADREHLATLVAERGLAISALSCHANPLHPDAVVAAGADEAYRDTVRLAAELGVATVITFSGCPANPSTPCGRAGSRARGRTTSRPRLRGSGTSASFPTGRMPRRLRNGTGSGSRSSLIQGFVVYNTASMLRLRESAGESVGVNFDPSHLFWQGMDPLACVNALGEAIFHVHAKDTAFQDERLALNGVLEPIPGNRPAERSWIFRSVGAGHPVEFWRELVAALGAAGYDGALSIEHEDPLLSHADGLELAVTTLRAALGRGG